MPMKPMRYAAPYSANGHENFTIFLSVRHCCRKMHCRLPYLLRPNGRFTLEYETMIYAILATLLRLLKK